MPVGVALVMPGVGVVARGAEAFVVELCERLARRPGFEVRLFSRGPGPAAVRHTRIRGLRRDQPAIGALYRATRLGRKALGTLFLDPLSPEGYPAALSRLPHPLPGGCAAVGIEGGPGGRSGGPPLRVRRGRAFRHL